MVRIYFLPACRVRWLCNLRIGRIGRDIDAVIERRAEFDKGLRLIQIKPLPTFQLVSTGDSSIGWVSVPAGGARAQADKAREAIRDSSTP